MTSVDVLIMFGIAFVLLFGIYWLGYAIGARDARRAAAREGFVPVPSDHDMTDEELSAALRDFRAAGMSGCAGLAELVQSQRRESAQRRAIAGR